MASAPLLFLDNDSLLNVLADGTFKFQTISFEEARAIIDMHGSKDDILRCFGDANLERIVYDYLGLPKRDIVYQDVRRMEKDQDGIIFRLYITESETRPIIKTEYGNEAKKIQNVYIHCELISRIS